MFDWKVVLNPWKEIKRLNHTVAWLKDEIETDGNDLKRARNEIARQMLLIKSYEHQHAGLREDMVSLGQKKAEFNNRCQRAHNAMEETCRIFRENNKPLGERLLEQFAEAGISGSIDW